MKKSVFDRYPQLKTLKGLVKDSIVEDEVKKKEKDFNLYQTKAKKLIKTVKLSDIFPNELEKGTIKLSNFLGHWGNINIESLAKIALIIKYFKPIRIFEFGTYNGMTTLQMALNSPKDSIIYTLDLNPKRTKGTKYELSVLDFYVAKVFRSKFNTAVGSYFVKNPLKNKIKQILSDSAVYDYSKFYGKIDFIFIDAAHDYKNKKSDSINSLKMLSKNGIIIWDNYDDIINPEVTKYLGELASKYPLFHLRGTALVFYWNHHEK